MSPLGNDRRRAPRVPASIAVEIHSGNGFTVYASSDLSVGGVFFDRAIPQPVGSQVTVQLVMPGEQAIRCTGEVVNVPDRTSFGMGVRFLDMSTDDQRRLEAFTQGLANSGEHSY